MGKGAGVCADRSAMSFEGGTPVMADATAAELTEDEQQYLNADKRFYVTTFAQHFGYSAQEAEAKLDSLMTLGMFKKEDRRTTQIVDGESNSERDVSYLITETGEQIRMARRFREFDPDLQTLVEFYAKNAAPFTFNGFDQPYLVTQLGYKPKEVAGMIRTLVQQKILYKDVIRYKGTRYIPTYWAGRYLFAEIKNDSPEWQTALSS